MAQTPRDLADRMSRRREGRRVDDGYVRETFTEAGAGENNGPGVSDAISAGGLHVHRRYLAGAAGRPDRVHHEAAEECGLRICPNCVKMPCFSDLD
jgi:hypothetical protein